MKQQMRPHTTMKLSKSVAKAVHATDQAEHPPIFTIGKSYLELRRCLDKDICRPLKAAVQEPYTNKLDSDRKLYLSLTESQTENDLVSMEAAGRRSLRIGVLEKSYIYQVSFSPSSWHYGWRSSKHIEKALMSLVSTFCHFIVHLQRCKDFEMHWRCGDI